MCMNVSKHICLLCQARKEAENEIGTEHKLFTNLPVCTITVPLCSFYVSGNDIVIVKNVYECVKAYMFVVSG